MTAFHPLETSAALEEVWRASETTPVIVFKHSQTCGISLMVRDGLAGGDVPAPIHEIVVQRQRDLSNAVATTLAVRHESPQVFVVAHRKAVWHSSHNGVTAARIAAAWRQTADTFTATPAR